MATQPKRQWVVQESDGESCPTYTSVSVFIRSHARLRCQLNPVGGDEHAISLGVGAGGNIGLHGALDDLRRVAELLRTTLEEYGDGPA